MTYLSARPAGVSEPTVATIRLHGWPYSCIVRLSTVNSERKDEDLTALARIRRAALASFGERGFEATSIRSIARRAGVSAGLVQHHFKTKDGLRRAVNRSVIDLVRRSVVPVTPGLAPSELMDEIGRAISDPIRSNPHLAPYLRRLFVESDAMALEMFDALMDATSQQLRQMRKKRLLDPDLDLGWAALHVVVIHLATIVFSVAINRHLDHEVLSEQGLRRFGDATKALFLRAHFDPDLAHIASPTGAPRSQASGRRHSRGPDG